MFSRLIDSNGFYSMEINIDDLTSPDVIGLLKEHLQHMTRITPPESVHALDIEALKKPEITFWSVWEGPLLIGCGALKELSPQHAEIKSMRTASSHLGKGVASYLLEHMLTEAKRRKYKRVSLETGSFDDFKPARNLYKKFGFSYCGPFSNYVRDPNTVFMRLEL
jgi:putative acetyltransferase